MRTALIEFHYWYIHRPLERLRLWFIWRLPRWLVYWCAMRLISYATVGKWGHENPSDLKAMDALDRWNANLKDAP